jgi:hypothetical protein
MSDACVLHPRFSASHLWVLATFAPWGMQYSGAPYGTLGYFILSILPGLYGTIPMKWSCIEMPSRRPRSELLWPLSWTKAGWFLHILTLRQVPWSDLPSFFFHAVSSCYTRRSKAFLQIEPPHGCSFGWVVTTHFGFLFVCLSLHGRTTTYHIPLKV